MDDYAQAQEEFSKNDTVYLEPPSAISPLGLHSNPDNSCLL
jgi:hypothetical protein